MPLSFTAIGDWGTVGANQTKIANAMGNHAAEHGDSFVVFLGDNFYPNGLSSLQDPQLENTYRRVYATHKGFGDIPFYAILGNHDYYQVGGPEAELAYASKKLDGGHWTMPGHVYERVYPLPEGGGGSVHMVFIDTSMIAVGEFKETSRGGIHEVSPSATLAALSHIESILRGSNATWLVVCGHFTIFSEFEHGDTQDLIRLVVPLLEKYRVSAYLNGHDHVLQHISHRGVEYITSGHGTLTDGFPSWQYTGASSASEGRRFGVPGPGYLTAAATLETLVFKFFDWNNAERYSFMLTNPRNGANPGLPIYPTVVPAAAGSDSAASLQLWAAANPGAVAGVAVSMLVLVLVLAFAGAALVARKFLTSTAGAGAGAATAAAATAAGKTAGVAIGGSQVISGIHALAFESVPQDCSNHATDDGDDKEEEV